MFDDLKNSCGVGGLKRFAAAALAVLTFGVGDASAQQDPTDLFYISDVRPVIGVNAPVRWFDGGADKGQISEFVRRSVATGVNRSMKGQRPLTLEVRVSRFLPVAPEESSAFGPGHEIRAEYVLIENATGEVLNVSFQNLDLFALWLQSTETIRGADGKGPNRRVGKHVAAMSELWGRSLTCRRMNCDVGSTSPAVVTRVQPTEPAEPVLSTVVVETPEEATETAEPAPAPATTTAAVTPAPTPEPEPTPTPVQTQPAPAASEPASAAPKPAAVAAQQPAPEPTPQPSTGLTLVLDTTASTPLPKVEPSPAAQRQQGFGRTQVRPSAVVDLSGAISAEE